MDVASLQIVTTDKGEYVAAVKKETGRPTAELLPVMLPRLITNIPFKKSMRWADLDVRFARPVHWIVSLYGAEVLPFPFGNVTAGRTTFGHRFLSPGAIPLAAVNA